MKILILLITMFFSSCSMQGPESLSPVTFPSSWRGYYSLRFGDSFLNTTGIKISENYITFRDLDGNLDYEFYTYKIREIYKDTLNPTDLIVSLDNAYMGMPDARGHIRLKRAGDRVYYYRSIFSYFPGVEYSSMGTYVQVANPN